MSEAATLLPLHELQPGAPLSVSQWADSRRVLTRWTSAESGPWRTERTPYLREIMDSFSSPEVEEIVVRSATQVGKTECILNMLGYVIDYDPAPSMVVLPRDEDAKNWAFKRVKPMIVASPSLEAHTTGKEDDLAGKLYTFDRMNLKFAGANSPADLGSDACRYVFCDELDKYPKFSGREADPVKLAIERTRTFWNRKIVKVSTPTLSTGYITRDYESSDRRRYYVPCPSCGELQPLFFSQKWSGAMEEERQQGQLCWPDGVDPETIKRDGLAYYQCGVCKARIEEHAKRGMIEQGIWVPFGATLHAGSLEPTPPAAKRGYHLSALYSPWVAWSEIAAEFLEAKAQPALLMAFVNSVLAEPWVERLQQTKAADLHRRCGLWAMGQVPQGAMLLTGGVDVQKDHFYYAIRGWGLGEESWLIRRGTVETFEELDVVLFLTDYPGQDAAHRVRLICIDSGYRTEEVYGWARRHLEHVRPIKGYEHLASGLPMRNSLIDRDARGQPIKGGMSLWSLDVDHYKTKLNRVIHTEPGDAGEWHLPALQEDDPYFDHLTSEQKITVREKVTGRVHEEWTLVADGRANHYLDCEVYNLAAADMLKVYLLRVGGEVQTYRPQKESSWVQRGGGFEGPRGDRGGWVRR
jgi:phage terminase large subunit GpA-like protein